MRSGEQTYAEEFNKLGADYHTYAHESNILESKLNDVSIWVSANNAR